MDSAVAVLAGAAFLKFYLHTVENGGIDDCLVVALDIVLRNLAIVDLRLFRKVVHGIGFLQKGVAFVFFVGKYPLDRGGVPFRLAGGTEVAVRLKLAADAVGRRALKEKAGYFLYRFRLRRVYHHPAVRAFVVAEESCSFRQMKNDSKPLYRYKTFLCSSLRG